MQVNCPECGSKSVHKDGRKNGKQRYECQECYKNFVFEQFEKEDVNDIQMTTSLRNTLEAFKQQFDTQDFLNEKILKVRNIETGANVLIIPDLHIPFVHKDALDFCKEVYDMYDCDTVVMLGDIFDIYCLSRYIKSPESKSSIDEFSLAKNEIAEWANVFPRVYCIMGNHELRIDKRLNEVGIPRELLKSLNDIFNLPKTWQWSRNIVINDEVRLMHGDRSGEFVHATIAKDSRQSTVIAHTHSAGSIHYMSGFNNTIFGMNCGCLIDDEKYAFNYASELTRRPVLGCGVLEISPLDETTIPHFIPMDR